MLNVVALNGRLTADPELRHTSNDIAVTSFTLAVDRSYSRSGTERQTDFIDIVCWRNTAEFASKYFHKGQLVAVEGSIQTRSYTDREGNKRRAFEVVASNVHFAEPRRDSYGNPGSGQSVGTQGGAPAIASGDNGDFVEIAGDDDLPF
ncbi:single-stranded DNA-binding protein [Ethanoligenens harbinense]|uniref:Single-stranded DNA-binding protein n=1 Tax=Ethanoligenens harbinense (strain DSM 18485 / JCM 12961 / CGMCC 1.5033 / YUAN-3) TaxID=663278 RepID=E6U6D8_ETHHY|nr:single-stranded DNA-binding protein [Ethanoligenens harbinense]ADU28008.1 single-strand binding protein [Ethanoligenens harbinense YUAN-3]AVQ97028.1 single-stranded DNA-binding protein [Ethanoligenens harbinense YUAN-3]AYF39689.1 single-stranded DNA-binding protein [Ethanoligenens harbinense]AYF42520.1 single-stranded DNA-binding protein [Ethanoligenens harbinense]QCN93270.1 single-stranded DNA-binding protein [Ethanoligenens harbinense]